MEAQKILVTLTITNNVLPASAAQEQDPEDLLTAAQAGKLLSLHPDTVRRMVRIGELESVGVGKRGIRIERRALERWRRAHRRR